jgi:glucose-1-phosphate thymidylyltransferase
VLIEPVHIERGARVINSIIGPNVSIDAGSVIEQSVIRNSIINADNRVSNMILENSLLGETVSLIGSPRRMNIGDHSHIEMDQ